MHEKVAAYLKEQQEKEAAAGQAERRELLLRLGLWEKEYAPEGETNLALYKETDENGRSWRKVPVPVTDEEWALIRRYDGQKRFSKWGVALSVFGVGFYLLAVHAFFNGGGLISLLIWAAGGTLLAATGRIVSRLDER